MDDGFQFGQQARRPARPASPKRPRRTSIDARLLWVLAGFVGAGLLAWVFLRGADEAGRELGGRNEQGVATIDRAHDAAAKGTLGRAVVVAQSLFAEHESFTTDLATLSAYDPSLRFTSGSSSDPGTVAYAVDAGGFGAGVRSASGTCWWVRIDTASTTTYGSGEPCTGSAAMAASQPSW
jgi:hypothetical protein